MNANNQMSAAKGANGSMPVIFVLCFAVVVFAAYFLVSREILSLSSVFLILLLLACPLMHLFMHRRHAGH